MYPQKERTVSKKNAIKGKKQIPTSKLDLVPIKENSFGVGSSNAFEAIDSATATKEEHIVESLVATPNVTVAQNSPELQAI